MESKIVYSDDVKLMVIHIYGKGSTIFRAILKKRTKRRRNRGGGSVFPKNSEDDEMKSLFFTIFPPFLTKANPTSDISIQKAFPE